MARLRIFTPGSWHFRYPDFGDAEIVQVSNDRLVLRYEFNPEEGPARAVVKLADATLYTPSAGREAGQDIVVSGEVARVTWFDGDGKRSAMLDRIDSDAGHFHHLLRHEPWLGFEHLVRQDSVFLGLARGEDAGADLATGPGDDLVRIRAGGSYIKDAGGADNYRGNPDGYDTLAYIHGDLGQATGQGIVANLRQGRVTGPDGEVDRIASIEEIRGTQFDDVFRGNGRDNIFHGHRGDDLIAGGGGFDIASYRRDEREGGDDGVVVNLARGVARDGFGTRDKLRSIEGIEGSKSDDVLRDNRKDNFFDGDDGDDRIFMKVGDDYARGDEGADTFIYLSRKFGEDKIGDFTPEEGDRIDIRAAATMGDLDVFTDENGTGIVLNANSSVFLEDYFGEVEPYLLL